MLRIHYEVANEIKRRKTKVAWNVETATFLSFRNGKQDISSQGGQRSERISSIGIRYFYDASCLQPAKIF